MGDADEFRDGVEVIVVLSWYELRLAAQVGADRRVTALKRGKVNRYGWADERDPWGTDVESSAAELAVSRATGRHWPMTMEAGGEDVAGGIQVRSTRRPNGCLLMYPGDSDDAPYVLARGSGARWELAGWIMGGDGKTPEYHTDRLRNGDEYLVPAAALRPVDELAVEAFAPVLV